MIFDGWVWYALVASAVGLQLICLYSNLWKERQRVFALAAILYVSSLPVLLLLNNFLALVSVLVLFYMSIDCMRVIRGKQKESYLRHSLRRSVPLNFTFLTVVWTVYIYSPNIGIMDAAYFVGLVTVCSSFFLVLQTINSLIKARTTTVGSYTDKQLPSVTLAFPARNETGRIADTLTAALASNYPKLEILVLDDCSQDSTPQIVREFAQDGIRFIEGKVPKAGWLGKNWAYNKLLDDASGEWVLFNGVDVRMSPSAIRSLVSYALDNDVDMVSVMPRRERLHFDVGLLAPPRYFRQLALPRIWRKNPPVLSTVWLVRKAAIEKMGGFKAVSNKVVPESYFARELAKTPGHSRYRFLLSNYLFNFRTHKKLNEMLETEHRTLYPEIRRQPFRVMFATVLMLVLFVLPFVVTVCGLFFDLGPEYRLFLGSAVALTLIHLFVTTLLYPTAWFFALFNFPLVIIVEIVALNYSMLQYEMDEVTWKGRNVCVPAMHNLEVIPRLPKI